VANTAANYYLSSHTAVRRLLGELSEAGAPDPPHEPVLIGCYTG
jgi:hypothetical protein